MVAGKHAELFDRSQLGFGIAAGKIRSAAAPTEQRIAREKCVFADKAHAAGGVSRSCYNLELKAGLGDNVAVVICMPVTGMSA